MKAPKRLTSISFEMKWVTGNNECRLFFWKVTESAICETMEDEASMSMDLEKIMIMKVSPYLCSLREQSSDFRRPRKKLSASFSKPKVIERTERKIGQ